MKASWIGILLSQFILFSFSNNRLNINDNQLNKTINSDSIPQLNQQIISFVSAHLKQKVGRGECWDLAAQPLNESGAIWDKEYRYGKVVDYRRDSIYPGDIIQFEGVEIKKVMGNMTIMSNLEHHTAVIYEVQGKGQYIIAHQNTSDFGRKVGLSELDLSNILRGSFTIYRPYK